MLTTMKIARLVLASMLVAPLALAADPKPKDPKGGKMKMDLGLPSFGAIPTGEGMVKPKAEKPADEPTVTAGNATYSVVRVLHGRSFMRTAAGATPVGGALEAIPLVGNPPSTEKFTTVIRVKSPQRVNVPIDVLILDPRGDTAMTATGDVNFRGQSGDEVDYTIDWEKTPTRAGGQFQVMVKLNGQVMGTWPLKVGVEPKAAPEPKK